MADATTQTLHPPVMTSQHVHFLSVVCVMLFLSTVGVVLRFVQRSTLTRSQGRFWWDDWVILAALLCTYGHLGGAISDTYSGYHITEYTVEELNDFSKVSDPIDSSDLYESLT